MNSVQAVLDAALAKAKALQSGTLSFTKSNGTVVSCTVFKSYLKDQNYDMEDTGYSETLDSMYVLAKPSDVSDWGLVPMKSVVTLDGTQFMIGRTIAKTVSYYTIWLRVKN